MSATPCSRAGQERAAPIPKRSRAPVLMLSAKSEDVDKILGLKTGADDYLTKPFNPLDLVTPHGCTIRAYNEPNRVVFAVRLPA